MRTITTIQNYSMMLRVKSTDTKILAIQAELMKGITCSEKNYLRKSTPS